MNPCRRLDWQYALAWGALAVTGGASAATTLPVPCAAGACGGVNTFVSAGQAAAVQNGSRLTVTQSTPTATLNWQSFNISADGSVQFVQPGSTSVALNKIFQGDPTKIFGTLTSNGQVFLINGNGIIFGPNAQVNVGSLVASTLNLTPLAANGALLAPSLASTPGPALVTFLDASGKSSSQPITVQQGATITTGDGGQILMFAPQITNAGVLSSPGGQTILAAGQSVYLASSRDPNLRGLLVEVGVGGTVTNGTAADAQATSPAQLVGQILADRGNITLAGLAVNQQGLLSATTTVSENGSIRLQARDQGAFDTSTGFPTPVANRGGTLTIGGDSVTQVALATSDPSVAADSVAQPKSSIYLAGGTVDVLGGASIAAQSGSIEIFGSASQNPRTPLTANADQSAIEIAAGASLDVSGAQIALPVSDNVIAVQLRGAELANSPLQRNGPLRGDTVYVDTRASGTRPDGSSWQGTPLADVSGEIAAIQKPVAERNLAGGSISLESQGQVVVSSGATLNVSGGSVTYTPGYLATSVLVTTTGQLVDMAHADPNVQYVGIAGPATVTDPRWGTTTNYAAPGSDPRGVYAPGYVEGKDAGSLTIVAPRFVLDGSVAGSVVDGPYQRAPTQPVPSGSLYRPVDQVPAGATLYVGSAAASPDFVVGSVLIAPETVLPALQNADGSAFNPLSDTLPATYTASVLRPDLFGPSGFARAVVLANGSIQQRADAALELPAGGGLSLTGSSVSLNAPIDAPSGTIAAVATQTAANATVGGITLGPDAQLTARGGWVNDSPALYPGGNFAPEFINGGVVTLRSQTGDLTLAPGSAIDVSGGAWLNARGVLAAGTGGSVQLSALPRPGVLNAPAPSILMDASLAAFGISQGGSLTIRAGGICIAAADCTAGDARVEWVSPALLTGSGFSSAQLTAGVLGLAVEPGTTLSLRQQNYILDAGAGSSPDQAALAGVAAPGLLIDAVRQPMNLSLADVLPANTFISSGTGLQLSPTSPSLLVGTGAVIDADPGASLSLAADGRVIVDGTLRAPGGSISLAITSTLIQAQPEPTQAIWLGADATLDVAGVARIIPDPNTGLRSGTVLPGGVVSMTANRGAIEILPGSLIDVSGTSAAIDVAATGSGSAQHSQLVASAGGAVNLSAAEGIVIGGAIAARAGVAGGGLAQPSGGALSVTIDASTRNDAAFATGLPSLFSQAPRTIVIGDAIAPTVVGPGLPVPDVLNGRALVSTPTLTAAGFDVLSFSAVPFQGAPAAIPGEILFNGGAGLTAARQISLDAAVVGAAPGAIATLSAPYVLIGNSDTRGVPVPAATPGTATLSVAGSLIELFGTVALQGFGSATYASTGDLQLRGLQTISPTNPSPALTGAVRAAGSITLSAQQIYPTTLSQFTIAADPAKGIVTIDAAPGPAGDVLSAGGALTLNASQILQDGTLRAPFGSITLNAATIAVGSGSVTSTSAAGLTIPFGTTQGGFDWVYPLTGITVVYGSTGAAPPAQGIALNGTHVALAPGATIDIAGGGDLQAYEWINGIGGTVDVLSANQRPQQFAILPSLNLAAAPIDPLLSAGTTLHPGDSVYLSAGAGVPAGDYILLPARYALLPGAFLVTPVAGYTDIQAGQTFQYPGGGTIVSGYRTVAGTGLGDSRTSGFAVVPAGVVLQQAQYTTTSADSFFASQATVAGAAVPSLPRDSGSLSITAASDLSIAATLLTQPATAGVGATVGISSNRILVEAPGSGGAAADPGTLVIDPASLNGLNAQNLLLGGTRSGNAITTTALSVTIASGSTLAGPDLLLAAQNQITISNSASVTASGAAVAPQALMVSGAGAFVDVSAGGAPLVTLTGSRTGGSLVLAQGSTVGAPAGGSATLAGTGVVSTAGALQLSGADLAIQSPTIGLGAAPSGVGGTLLGASVLEAGGLRSLQLTAASALDVYGSVQVAVQNLSVGTPLLQGVGTASDTAAIDVSGTLALLNKGAASTGALGATGGTLQLTATDVSIGGSIGVSGFSAVTVSAGHEVSASVYGALQSGGALTVTTPLLTTTAGSTLGLASPGAVRVLAPTSGSAPSAATGLGGALVITGGSIEIGTRLDVPSGSVTLTTAGSQTPGNVTLDAGAVITAAGVTRSFDSLATPTPGGSVVLAASGNVSAASGSQIDVGGGAANAAGGSLSIAAPSGTVQLAGTMAGAGAGAAFSLDAQSFGDFGALNAALNSGGFGGSRSIRLRGPGDIVIQPGAANAVLAQDVVLEADGGSAAGVRVGGNILVNGTIDASGTNGGSVLLAAAGDVTVAGTIDVHATLAGAHGGGIDLETQSGRLLVAAGSVLDLSGGPAAGAGPVGAGGTLLLRAPQATVAGVTAGGGGVRLDGSVVGAAATTLEGFATYSRSAISDADVAATSANPIYAAAASFMSDAPAIAAALGRAGDATFSVVPGVEIDSAGALTVASTWDLAQWRFNGNPGVLTLRAAGGVTFAASLSDGFADVNTFTLSPTPSNSWSYRIVAGADLSAANVRAVNAGTPADVTLVPGVIDLENFIFSPTIIRTGNGFVDIAASGRLVLGNEASMIYTAGVAAPGITNFAGANPLNGLAYGTDGGNIRVNVGGDIVGAPTDQFVSAWLFRAGGLATSPSSSATGWAVNYFDFEQGIGALAGGDVTIRAGGNISNLSVSIPSIGRQVGGATLATSVVDVTGGGTLAVAAGGSILGGSFDVGLGTATVTAGRNVGAVAVAAGGTGIAPLFGIGDATLSVTAAHDLSVAGVVNPTLLPVGVAQGSNGQVMYSTYAADSSATLVSVGGAVTLSDQSRALQSALPSMVFGAGNNSSLVWNILPPHVAIEALGGDVNLQRSLLLSPSPTGALDVFAEGSVNAAVAKVPVQLVVSDADPLRLPSPGLPGAGPSESLGAYADLASATSLSAPDQHAAAPIQLGVGGATPSRIVAATGDIAFAATIAGQTSGLWTAGPARVIAGRDIVNLDLTAQNLGPSDVTLVAAGRNIVYPLARGSVGQILQSTSQIAVDGEGELDILAGGTINLGVSLGVSTRGNIVNPALPADGANVAMMAGIGGGTPDYAAFIQSYLIAADAYDAQLLTYVGTVTGQAGLGVADAKQEFLGLSADLQRDFANQVFLEVLRASGRQAATSGSGDFSAGFAAIGTLFPGANPDVAGGQSNPYSGDIDLYFSRVYTLAGGNISMLAPGGGVNAGLANPPSTFSVNKSPSQLGIVAQSAGDVSAFVYSDFQVNQSRVFAADGGNILVWSTRGNIDAGRGAKTSISAPPPTITFDINGLPVITFPQALFGSGIQTLATSAGVKPGDVDLFAPHGVVNANDAGIVAGNLTIAATAVLGASNISVSGASVGVPVAVTGLNASTAGAAASAGGAANAGQADANASRGESGATSPAAEAALGWLEVFVTGLGEEQCRPDDLECLKRQPHK